MTSDTLRGAVDQADPHAEPGSLPAVTQDTLTAFGAPDQVRILQILGLDPRNPVAHAVVAVCERYRLDPVLGHVMILPKSNRPYITVDGYRHIAHASGVYDGMTVTDGPRREPQEREWVATVAVYRKDMSRPFEMPGRAGLSLDNGQEMALTRAKRRALREAFDVTVPPAFAEDEWDDRPAVPYPAPAAAGDAKLTSDQRKAVQAGFARIGMRARAQRTRLLTEWAGREISSVSDLTAAEADDAVARLAALRDEHARQDAAGGPGDAAGFPAAPSPGPGAERITREQRIEINRLLSEAGITGRADAASLISGWAGREVASTGELRGDEIRRVMEGAAALTTLAGRQEDSGDHADG